MTREEVPKVRLIVRYTACLGLANQLYSHVTAIALSRRLGADMVLSPSAYRSTFEHAWDSSEAEWRLASTSTILDVDYLIGFWRERNMTIHRVRKQASLLYNFPVIHPAATWKGLKPHTGYEPHAAFCGSCFGSSAKGFSLLQMPYVDSLSELDPNHALEPQVFTHPELVLTLGRPVFLTMNELTGLVTASVAAKIESFQSSNPER